MTYVQDGDGTFHFPDPDAYLVDPGQEDDIEVVVVSDQGGEIMEDTESIVSVDSEVLCEKLDHISYQLDALLFVLMLSLILPMIHRTVFHFTNFKRG